MWWEVVLMPLFTVVYYILFSEGIFWCTPAELYFAGALFTSKSAPAKFKMHQQNLRCTSKIINPIFDMSSKRNA